MNRDQVVLRALQGRIAASGDMHIRVSRRTFAVLMRGVGLGVWEDFGDDFREVDALALDMLRHLAVARLGLAS